MLLRKKNKIVENLSRKEKMVKTEKKIQEHFNKLDRVEKELEAKEFAQMADLAKRVEDVEAEND
jgi:hypothetical protein